MTRKDFEAIAAIIRDKVTCPTVYDRDTVASMAAGFAGYAKTTNPRFDTGRFMRACGL